jgi:hypothetical protein
LQGIEVEVLRFNHFNSEWKQMTTYMAIARREPPPGSSTPHQDNEEITALAHRVAIAGNGGAVGFLSIVVLIGMLIMTGHADAAQIASSAALTKALVGAWSRMYRGRAEQGPRHEMRPLIHRLGRVFEV